MEDTLKLISGLVYITRKESRTRGTIKSPDNDECCRKKNSKEGGKIVTRRDRQTVETEKVSKGRRRTYNIELQRRGDTCQKSKSLK